MTKKEEGNVRLQDLTLIGTQAKPAKLARHEARSSKVSERRIYLFRQAAEHFSMVKWTRADLALRVSLP